MKPNQQEKCAHKKNLGESCSQCNEAWNDMTSPHQEAWAERFDEKFTYLDENGDRYLLGSFDKDKNISTDNIPDIKSFIRQELTTLHKADCERFREMIPKENNGESCTEVCEKRRKAGYSCYHATQDEVTNAIRTALSKMEEDL